MTTEPLRLLQTFRQELFGVFSRRADALFELADALLLTLHPRSPVELSTSPAFRRRFSMVYDAIRHGQVEPELTRELLATAEPANAITVAGYAVYAMDSTTHPRPDAETLPDRGKVYSAGKKDTVPGHQYSWLGRVMAQGQSWFAPRDVERVATSTTDWPSPMPRRGALVDDGQSTPAAAAEQVKRLALTLASGVLAVIVADSHYAKHVFLAVFVTLPNLCVLVRLARNRVLYGPPPVTGPRHRGRPKVHGQKFRPQSPPEPERQSIWSFGKATVRLSAWTQLHFKGLPALVGMVVRVEFLTAAGEAMYQRPLWLFWSGPSNVPLEALCLMTSSHNASCTTRQPAHSVVRACHLVFAQKSQGSIPHLQRSGVSIPRYSTFPSNEASLGHGDGLTIRRFV